MKKIAVILSGCGKLDGSEIHEATLTLLNIDLNGAKYQCASIDGPQARVMDHLAGKESAEKRNMMVESARIARGAVVKISAISPSDYDAVIFPGGFGAALNLCDFALNGGEGTKVNPAVEKIVLDFHAAKKPIGAICIAPVIVAKVLASKKARVTIGNDAATAAAINKWGAQHVNCSAEEICFDPNNLLVTTPAYMLAQDIASVHRGIEKLVKKILSL